jgi:lambda repressor-like predicted transcriptional regulator
MGGSGGYGFGRAHDSAWQPADLENSLQHTRQQVAEAELASVFADALSKINQIDTEALNLHKEEILKALQSEFEDASDLRGGGSYTRHTYVNGLSDVDILIDLGAYSSSSIPHKADSRAVLADMERRLRQRFPHTHIESGRMAVTIRFSDGLELQVLPAFRYHSGYKIPNPQGSGWTITRPQVFAKLLRERNAEIGGKVLPCIKLAKQVCNNKGVEIKSYHLENMVLKAFEHYTGSRSEEEMLRHLFNQAKVLVATRMKDVTGQEVYVDRYLSNKTARNQLARQLATIEKEIIAAKVDSNVWKQLLGSP